jgi:hypothetical protein
MCGLPHAYAQLRRVELASSVCSDGKQRRRAVMSAATLFFKEIAAESEAFML